MPDEERQLDEARLMELEESRAQERARAEAPAAKPVLPRINFIEAGLVIGFAATVDLLDYFVIGAIPVAGDALDLAAGGAIWLWVVLKGLSHNRSPLVSWSPWIATGVEIIPIIGDLPPSFTIDVLLILALNTEAGRNLVKIISPI